MNDKKEEILSEDYLKNIIAASKQEQIKLKASWERHQGTINFAEHILSSFFNKKLEGN